LKLVILESPYAGNITANLAYARAAMRDSLDRGEAPFASHLLYTQMLDDNDPRQRTLGIKAGQSWLLKAEAVAVYTDLGISAGMKIGIQLAELLCRPIEYRSIVK